MTRLVNMIVWLGRWKERNKVLVQGISVLSLMLGLAVAAGTIANAAYSYYSNVDLVEWGTTTFPVRNTPDDQRHKAIMDKLAKTPGYMTIISLPNNTRLKLTGVMVQSNRKGYLGYTNPKGDINELGVFDGRKDLPDIPPYSALGLTLWHSEEPKANDTVEVSTEQTGKISLPYHTKGKDVSRWYFWGFWSCFLILLAIVGFQGLKWRRNQKEQGPQLQETKDISNGTKKKGKKGKKASPAGTPT